MRTSAPDAALLMIVNLLLAFWPEHSRDLQDLGYALGRKTQFYVIHLLLALQDQERIRVSASVR